MHSDDLAQLEDGMILYKTHSIVGAGTLLTRRMTGCPTSHDQAASDTPSAAANA